MRKLLGIGLIGLGILMALTVFNDGDSDRERAWSGERPRIAAPAEPAEPAEPAAPEWRGEWRTNRGQHGHYHGGFGIFLGLILLVGFGVVTAIMLAGGVFWWQRHQQVRLV